jgi:hypothetical protein
MRRLGTIPEAMPRITARHGESLAICVKDIEDAQSLNVATGAPFGQILDRLEHDFKAAFTEQMRPDGPGHHQQSR